MFNSRARLFFRRSNIDGVYIFDSVDLGHHNNMENISNNGGVLRSSEDNASMDLGHNSYTDFSTNFGYNHQNMGIDSDVSRAKHASQESIDLESLKVKEEGDHSSKDLVALCSICLDEVPLRKAIRMPPPCSHIFHGGCISKWLNIRNTCPLCRRTAPLVLNNIPLYGGSSAACAPSPIAHGSLSTIVLAYVTASSSLIPPHTNTGHRSPILHDEGSSLDQNLERDEGGTFSIKGPLTRAKKQVLEKLVQKQVLMMHLRNELPRDKLEKLASGASETASYSTKVARIMGTRRLDLLFLSVLTLRVADISFVCNP
ncbi:hypothetical protein Fmac_025135 [Flemingia macrophylla]|uniref:RING-type E3 ubiquitin transferase n=1 Tax=Flemingia macrophylla TaxID=520843 RepID=A0ABD1LRE0_9FABA